MDAVFIVLMASFAGAIVGLVAGCAALQARRP